MGKKLLTAAVCAALFGILASTAFAAPKAPAGDAKIALPEGMTATKAVVGLNHETHKALDCKSCHHTWDGKSDKIGACAEKGCHASADPANKTGKDSFYMAFHKPDSKHSCVGCHKATVAGGAKAGPVVCNKCHPAAN